MQFQFRALELEKMEKVTKDLYKRIYKDNGSYTYPKVAENKVWSKGGMYFKGMELIGSNERKEKNPKVSLLKVYKKKIILAIEEKMLSCFI